MSLNGFLVRRVALSNVLSSCRRVSSVSCQRSSSFRTLLPAEAVVASSKLNGSVASQGWRGVDACRFVQTATFSVPAQRETCVSTSEMDTEIGGTGHAQTMIVYLDDFIHRLDSGTIKLIDVRESSEIEETGSIPTSINIPLEQLKLALLLSDEEFLTKFDMEKPHLDDTNIVFYDLSPARSAAAVKIANELGFKWAQHYIGGWQEWSLSCRDGYMH